MFTDCWCPPPTSSCPFDTPNKTGFYSAQVAGETITACGEKLTPDTCIDAGALAQRIIEKFFRCAALCAVGGGGALGLGG